MPEGQPVPAAGPSAAPKPARKRKRSLLWVWLILALLALVGVVAGLLATSSGSGEEYSSGKIATAEVGPLVVTITEDGEVEAGSKKIIRNELRWQVTITELAPEGPIKPGDTIIKFDCRELDEALDRKITDVRNAEGALKDARNNAKLVQLDTQNEMEKAKRTFDAAKLDQQKYVDDDGEYQKQLNEIEQEIKLAEQDLKLADQQLQFKKRANADPSLNKPYSKNEIESEELKVQRLLLNLRKSKARKRMLELYDKPIQEMKLQTAVNDAKLALRRAEVNAEIQRRQAEYNVKYKELALRDNQKNLDELKEQKTKLHIVADEPGLIEYNVGGNRWWRPNVVVAVGEKIDRWQQLMIIPDRSTWQVKTKVFESMITDVRRGNEKAVDGGEKGMRATIRLDALPGIDFPGYVDRIAPMPNSQDRFNPNVKTFDVVVQFDKDRFTADMTEALSRITSGNAKVELEVDVLPMVLQVPIAAVFSEQERRYVWKLDDDGQPHQVDVRVGAKNATMVQILSGLQKDDTVLLVPPRGGAVSERPIHRVRPRKVPKATSQPAGKAAAPQSRPATTRPAKGKEGKPRAEQGGRRRRDSGSGSGRSRGAGDRS